jgi:hypothetical protein
MSESPLGALIWLWQSWKRLAHKIGNFQARILLTVIYAIVLFPIGILVRIFADPLSIRHRPAKWKDTPLETQDMDWARRQ